MVHGQVLAAKGLDGIRRRWARHLLQPFAAQAHAHPARIGAPAAAPLKPFGLGHRHQQRTRQARPARRLADGAGRQGHTARAIAHVHRALQQQHDAQARLHLAAGGEVLHVGRVVGMQVQPGTQHPHTLQVALQRRLHAFRRRRRGLDMQGADNGHGQAGFSAGEGTGRCGSDSGRRWGTGRPWSHRALAQRFFSTPQTRRAPGHGMLATCDNKCK